MSAFTDKARDFWDRISPRERKLVVVLAIVTPITLAIWLGFSIQDGLEAMEARNDRMRKALDVVADMRARGQTHDNVDDVVAKMGTESLSLDTYLNKAAEKAKFTLKSTSPHTPVQKNGFITTSVSASLDKLTIEQVRAFLQTLETDSKVVAVTHLELRKDWKEKDKLQVNIEVSTYAKEPPPKGEGSAAGSDAKKGG